MRARREAEHFEDFDRFYEAAEPRLREALTAKLGAGPGREAAVDALSYAWEHWDRVGEMDNPIGYLYVVGRDRGTRALRRTPPALLPAADRASTPWIEPGLPDALSALPDQQRVVVMLLYCFQWSMAEVADLMQLSKSTVQTHAERGLGHLREQIGAVS